MNHTTPPHSQPLPFAQACENNQAPIFAVLQTALQGSRHVLEIGSGTGQHSVYFAPRLPHLTWQTSDLTDNHPGIQAWHAAHAAPNLRAPLEFDLATSAWPAPADQPEFDAVFTSNTCHIVAWPLVQRMFELVGTHLPAGGVFAIYGPFNYGGRLPATATRPLMHGCASAMPAVACVILKPWWRWPNSTACNCSAMRPCQPITARWCFVNRCLSDQEDKP